MQRVRQTNNGRVYLRIVKQLVVIRERLGGFVSFVEFRPPAFIQICASINVGVLKRLRGDGVLLARPPRADDPEIILFQRSTLPRCFFTWLRLRFVSKILSFRARGRGRFRRRIFSRSAISAARFCRRSCSIASSNRSRASFRFCAWDRESWTVTLMPVGRCRRVTAVETLLTF